MDRKRILKEAQKIAANFSFWMVSGDISHLYGYISDISDTKYELEIKFDENFPISPPKFFYYDEIKKLLGDFQLTELLNWAPNSVVVNIIQELKSKIQEALQIIEDKSIPSEKEEYLTPDLNVYPPDDGYHEYLTPSYSENQLISKENSDILMNKNSKFDSQITETERIFEEQGYTNVNLNTELGLIQEIYAFDQKSSKTADINVYITITLTRTFIISIDFTNYPEKPLISFPEEIFKFLGDPNNSLDILKSWNAKNPQHIVNIIHELEKKLYCIKDIESQFKNISGEYHTDIVPNTLTNLKVHLLTYGFKEYIVDMDLSPYPKPPIITLSPELKNIINIPIKDLSTFKNWKENLSESVEIVREISWLVDKNSRINFEIDLLKDHYKNIIYDSTTATLNVDMKGKMKTQDIIFKFEIILPIEYPMKIPEIKVLNEFELESHENIKNDLHSSFDNFFNQWTPFSYLVDLFNLISKKIFEVSVVSCVICHKIECPSCSKKIAGEDNCHAECPHCNRAYHNHCWEQTIKSFGKCGFCLR